MIISYNYHRALVLRVQMYDIIFDSQSITAQNSEKKVHNGLPGTI